jgi:hypothetical protein
MAGTLGLLAAVTAVPMLWLSNGAPGEAVEGTEGERERLLAGERREEADGNVRV